jgi:RNA polymerase sigma-70 factor (ECF subfamily)
MHTTSASLLEQLRQPADQGATAAAWGRFVQLYTPLLFFWARRLGLQEPDAADLVQDVFTVLLQKLPSFRYDQRKGFRNWLRTIIVNKWRDRKRREAVAPVQAAAGLAELPVPDDTEAFGEAEYRQQLVGRALELMQAEFAVNTWKACWEHVVSGRPAAEVAAELGISVNAVYVAKSRVLRRLHQELDGLMD